jgi:hypothetical protein
MIVCRLLVRQFEGNWRLDTNTDAEFFGRHWQELEFVCHGLVLMIYETALIFSVAQSPVWSAIGDY